MKPKPVANKRTTAPERAAGRDIVLFDGVCNLCNGAVDFILDRDPEGNFVFASLQSGAGQELLSQYGLSTSNFDSVLLIRNGRVFKKSRAAIEIAARLKGPWPLMQVFKVVPSFIADVVYDFIGKNRYRFFGKKETCRFPTPDIRSRFLEGL